MVPDEPYAVYFVSANKHATVYHRYVGQLIAYCPKYLKYAFFPFFANFRKYAKFLARSILNLANRYKKLFRMDDAKTISSLGDNNN